MATADNSATAGTERLNDLTAFKRDLLYVIAGLDEPHGLAIKPEIEEYLGKEVHAGRLYPNLDDLVGEGLIEKREADGRTNSYSLTSEGRKALQARSAWEEQYTADISN